MSTGTATEIRLHVGNISPKLAENLESLNTRFSKFGTIVKPLEVHTKVLADKYFGFITLSLTPVDYEKIRNAFHEVVFMGMKLTINEAKPAYNWTKDNARPDLKKSDRLKRERIAISRESRIRESTTQYSENLLEPGKLSQIGYIGTSSSNASALGYLKSSHTTNNKSGNTKNKPPSSTLRGLESYNTVSQSKGLINSSISKISGNGEILKGRHRVTSRSKDQIRNSTLRILINGELKTYKNYKTKLWGIEKDRTARDMTWKFIEGLNGNPGVWRSGDDHIIEKVENKVSKIQSEVQVNDIVIGGPDAVKCGIDSKGVEEYGNVEEQNIKEIEVKDNVREIDEEFVEDFDKNNKVLASLFSKYDFDKPLSIEEDEKIDTNDITFDSKGRRKVKSYDYEIEGGDISDDANESDESFDYSTAQQKVEEYTKLHNRPDNLVHFDENDDGNELDFEMIAQSTEAIKGKYEEEHKVGEEYVQDAEEARGAEDTVKDEEMEDSEEEFIPTFGGNKTETNETEALRSLFNKPTEQPTFSLSIDEEDIDQEKENELNNAEHQAQVLKEIELKQREDLQKIQEQRKNQFGLFWTHSNSPFLATQSQLNKIGTAEDVLTLPGEEDGKVEAEGEGEENTYEKWFWDQRGELSRECKRRRRDVMRAFKKKVNV